LASEELAEQHGIHISRETLRHWLIEAKLWRPRRARVNALMFGELACPLWRTGAVGNHAVEPAVKCAVASSIMAIRYSFSPDLPASCVRWWAKPKDYARGAGWVADKECAACISSELDL